MTMHQFHLRLMLHSRRDLCGPRFSHRGMMPCILLLGWGELSPPKAASTTSAGGFPLMHFRWGLVPLRTSVPLPFSYIHRKVILDRDFPCLVDNCIR